MCGRLNASELRKRHSPFWGSRIARLKSGRPDW